MFFVDNSLIIIIIFITIIISNVIHTVFQLVMFTDMYVVVACVCECACAPLSCLFDSSEDPVHHDSSLMGRCPPTHCILGSRRGVCVLLSVEAVLSLWWWIKQEPFSERQSEWFNVCLGAVLKGFEITLPSGSFCVMVWEFPFSVCVLKAHSHSIKVCCWPLHGLLIYVVVWHTCPH